MNCRSCVHVGSVPGSAHVCCQHPKNKEFLNDPLMGFLGIFASVGRTKPQISQTVIDLEIEINPHGLRNGWANWPWNFDPVWINNCNAFKERENLQK